MIAIHTDHNGVAVTAETAMVDGQMMYGHKYRVSGFLSKPPVEVLFQCGAVKVNGANGLTNEALLAILINRTEVLEGMFPCVQNRMAIKHMQDALELFEARTRERLNRGVEGQNKA
jgi:hypothetical protein